VTTIRFSGSFILPEAIAVAGSPTAARQLVLIASTMRSGSTLLKSLLAYAPDVSGLNEVNFQRYAGRYPKLDEMWGLAPQRILVLKHPAWFHERARYPRLPGIANRRVIVLVRDVYPTVESLRRMTLGRFAGPARPQLDRWLAKSYWQPVTRRLLELYQKSSADVRLVRYEDLIARPQELTRELFEFIGSVQSVGTDIYSVPNHRKWWRWRVGDNSPKLRSLRVQNLKPSLESNLRLAELIEADTSLTTLRRELGYL
jgi:hypothetical protein